VLLAKAETDQMVDKLVPDRIKAKLLKTISKSIDNIRQLEIFTKAH
jgi:hypothetical protein